VSKTLRAAGRSASAVDAVAEVGRRADVARASPSSSGKHQRIYFGRDVTDALEWVHGFTSTRESLVRLGPPSAERALGRLQKTLVAHAAADGVWFDARAWIVKAHRG
jgi:hypothetical protein